MSGQRKLGHFERMKFHGVPKGEYRGQNSMEDQSERRNYTT